MFAGIALFAVRTIGGSVVTDALADAPNAHAVADDAWAIATSLLVDAAEGSFLFGLFLPPAPGSWARAAAPRRSGASPRIPCASVPASCAPASGRDPAARHLGPVPWTRKLWGIAIFTVLAYLWLELVRRRTLEQFPDEPAPAVGSPALAERRPGRRARATRGAARTRRLSQAEFDREKAALLADGQQPAEA